MGKFNSKEKVFDYILNEFGKGAKTVLIRGSTANGPVKSFSDFDVEVYGKKKYPIYQIHTVNGYPVLLTVYFYDYKFGSLIPKPNNIKTLKGTYTSGTEEMFEKEIKTKVIYKGGEVMIRKHQLLMESFFQFMRTGNEEALQYVQKNLDFSSLPPMKLEEKPVEDIK